MIISKIKKIILILPILVLTQCYTEPFFELTVNIIDGNTNPIPNATVTVEVTDVENGDLVEGSILYFESITNSSGTSMFNFENKAFVTVRACFENNLSDIEENEFLCKEGHIYLEENINKTITLMLQSDDCTYCF